MLALWLLRLLGVMTSFVSELCVSGLLPHAWNCSATCSLASSGKSQTLYSLNNLYPHWEDGPASQKTFERRQCLSHVLQEVMEMKGLLVGEWQVNSRNRRMHAAAWSGWVLWLQVIVSPVSSPLGNKLILGKSFPISVSLWKLQHGCCFFLLCQMGHPWAEKTTHWNFICLKHFWLPRPLGIMLAEAKHPGSARAGGSQGQAASSGALVLFTPDVCLPLDWGLCPSLWVLP